ncbi:hypothetical protein GT347_03260 [Xylophilus rhododendri]|uniref:Uncharacterized protein n=1 Tax=Xylophilus rhododendri TaxID=2697032 RepID=A0A857J0H2_9BURK|nr:hypothetical protein [Xylophilus rhododendri]QHI97087.1 hypothetical protein GT347_03260 [Xylophilus rhododendri]
MDEVFAAIGAAMAETRGRTLEQIDPAADAAIAAARRQVSITLQDYPLQSGPEPAEAQWRYRQELERALHGPLAVPGALRAWTLASESDGNSLSAEERQLAQAWVVATQRARAEGMRGLAESHTAWFEVRAVKPPAAPSPMAQPAPAPSRPVQSSLF